MKEHPVFKGYIIEATGKVYSCWKMQSKKKFRGGFESYIDYDNPVELMQRTDKDGYKTVALSAAGKSSYRVHRLVAETYLKNPEHFKEVNHINEVKDDNRLENLEWCNRKKNASHSLCKHIWTIEHIESGKTWEVINFKQFCVDNNLSLCLKETYNQSRGRTQHKGYRVIDKREKESVT